jgi:hypothetical protein
MGVLRITGRYAFRAFGAPGFRFTRPATPPTLNSTHIFAVAGTLGVPLSQPQKRHIQPERYEEFFLGFLHAMACTL